jgi:hypothetical protein
MLIYIYFYNRVMKMKTLRLRWVNWQESSRLKIKNVTYYKTNLDNLMVCILKRLEWKMILED